MLHHYVEMKRLAVFAALGIAGLASSGIAAQPQPVSPRAKVVIPFDFESEFDEGRYGQKLGDMIWKKLERRGKFVIPEAMLDVRQWSERTKTVPGPDTSLEKMKSIVRGTFGADIGIWGKIERLPNVDWDQYDLWINVVDFSQSPPRTVAEIEARTKTVSEIPHVYVKQALDELYGVGQDGETKQQDEEAERNWKTAPNLVRGTFDTGKGWDPPGRYVSREVEREGQKTNRFIRFNIPRSVAVTTGVLYYSEYFPIEAGAKYRFQCRWRSSAPAAKVFIKCYAERPTRFTKRPEGKVRQTEKREVYRSQQNLKGPSNNWNTQTEDFTPKHTQYEPRFGRVMLYGYLREGMLDWDDVVVKKIAPPPESQTPRVRRPSLETKTGDYSMIQKSCLLTALIVTAGLVPTNIRAAELYVSPSGVDGNPGTQANPLASIAAAQKAARGIRDEPVTVYLEGGAYYLREPVVFTAADSGTAGAPVVYAAAPGQSPVISGGRRLELDWHPYRDGIMQADVPRDLECDQLFINGERQPMARWPNYDPRAQYFQGFSADATSPKRISRWSNPAGGFVHAMHRNLWGDMHWKITGKTKDNKLEMVGGWQNNRQMGAHKKFRFVENIFEELDAPGEWYHDTEQRVLYVLPPEGVALPKAKCEVVRLKHLVEFRGDQPTPVQHITLKDITFTHAARTFMENKEPLLRSDWTTYRGGAILFDGAEDCQIRDCLLDQVGGNAIFVNEYNRRITVAGCHIAGAGASGVSFVGDPDALRSPLFEYHETQTLQEMDHTPGPKTPNYPADCAVENCLIHRNGRVEKQTAGVNICMAESITVRHCSIYDCPRAGINICDGAFGGHLIQFCDVFDTVQETGDHGSFNSWGRDRFWHPNRDRTVQWVEAHPDMPKWDCRKTIVIRNNRWRCDHGWDIDLDDGSSNYKVYNNLCLSGGIKLREGYYREVYNNVLVNYTFCPHVWYPNCRTSFRHNIIWRDSYAAAGMQQTDQTEGIDFNLVHEPGAAPRPAKKLRKFGGDDHTNIADARFVDPLAGDYRVRKGSPALSRGFKNFPMDQFGVRKSELKELAETPPLPGTLEAAGISSGGWGRRYKKPQTAAWLGATFKTIETDGEMSAVGLGDKKGVLVVDVPEGSTADQQGLQQNDVVRAFNGQPVEDLQDFARFCRNQGSRPATLKLWRNQADYMLKIAEQ